MLCRRHPPLGVRGARARRVVERHRVVHRVWVVVRDLRWVVLRNVLRGARRNLRHSAMHGIHTCCPHARQHGEQRGTHAHGRRAACSHRRGSRITWRLAVDYERGSLGGRGGGVVERDRACDVGAGAGAGAASVDAAAASLCCV